MGLLSTGIVYFTHIDPWVPYQRVDSFFLSVWSVQLPSANVTLPRFPANDALFVGL